MSGVDTVGNSKGRYAIIAEAINRLIIMRRSINSLQLQPHYRLDLYLIAEVKRSPAADIASKTLKTLLDMAIGHLTIRG